MEINQGVFELDPSEYVSSLNSLTGDVILAAGTNISLVPVGNTITINATDTDTGITELTGDVTAGPGSGSQVATLATVNSNVGSFTNASVTVNAKGLVTAVSSGTAPVTSVSGTLNRITSTGGTTPVIDISASYVGQASITTLGTITTGIWNGTAIANANLANSSITIGSTAISLGATSTTLAGLTSVTSTTFVGALTGNASTATALATGRTIAITGDLAYTSGSFDGTGNVTGTGTLATVNADVGSFGSSTSIPTFTVNAKGLITAASGNAVIAPAGTLTGTTLASNVVTSSLTSVGTLAGLTVTAAPTFSALTSGRIPYATTAGLLTDSTGLTYNGTTFSSGILSSLTSSNALFEDSVTDTAGTLLNVTYITNTTANGSFNNFTYDANVTKKVASGVSDGGRIVGMRVNVLRNFLTTADSGTLASLQGMVFQHGNHNLGDAAATPITTESLGFQVGTLSLTGTITTATDFRIPANSAVGTVTTHVGLEIGALVGTTVRGLTMAVAAASNRHNLYISGTANNYIEGNVSIGGTATAASTDGALALINSTAPTGSITDGTAFYSADTKAGDSNVYARNEAGTTTIVTNVKAFARSTAQTAAVASVATYTVGSADASFQISANVLVTTSTTHNFTVTCAYTDEGNTARTLTLMFSSLAGGVVTAIANAAGAVPYMGVPVHIRCKASTAITIATTGTFTTVTYNVEGIIRQMQ